jgi:hypothetical protein
MPSACASGFQIDRAWRLADGLRAAVRGAQRDLQQE